MPAVGSSSSIISGRAPAWWRSRARACGRRAARPRAVSAKPARPTASSSSQRARRRARRARVSERQKSKRVAALRAAARCARSPAPSGAGTRPRSGTSAPGPSRATSAGFMRGDVAAVVADACRAVGVQELGEQVEAGGLAGAVGADQRVDACPRRTRRSTSLTATKPLNSLVRPARLEDDVVGHQARSRGTACPLVPAGGIEARLALSRPRRGWPRSISHEAMQSRWAAITSSIIARGSWWNDSWSSRLVWRVGGAAPMAQRARRSRPASRRRSAGAHTQFTRPMARAPRRR